MKLLNGAATAAVLAAAMFVAPAADAAVYTFVGSWQVDQGPFWGVSPPAYTGQDAAALLFGGVAADYAISTISSLVVDIDFMAWVSVWGGGESCFDFPCGVKVAQDFVTSTGGLYDNHGDTSALVNDWAVGEQFRNYAFAVAPVPLPAAFPMLAVAIAGMGVMAKRRKNAGKKAV